MSSVTSSSHQKFKRDPQRANECLTVWYALTEEHNQKIGAAFVIESDVYGVLAYERRQFIVEEYPTCRLMFQVVARALDYILTDYHHRCKDLCIKGSDPTFRLRSLFVLATLALVPKCVWVSKIRRVVRLMDQDISRVVWSVIENNPAIFYANEALVTGTTGIHIVQDIEPYDSMKEN